MPRTDLFFDQLLTLGLRDSRNLKKVVVINPDPRIASTIQQFFDQHFFSRNVKILPIRFGSLHSSVSDIEPDFGTENGLDNFLERRLKLFETEKK